MCLRVRPKCGGRQREEFNLEKLIEALREEIEPMETKIRALVEHFLVP